ncbi:MAG: nucleotidyl transferase AbiEii/AbiGii toxin family protein [Gammaproteobacteria bacterium]|nr:nucleotidyl transferase AbiEii/AbiGii toxin family protein [Gammaproteobacteria bacterium]MCY4278454.1 nucleotidyl transferase AbiEii/AbiGii toxin family protein [Gammaproteobacteria bacterium]
MSFFESLDGKIQAIWSALGRTGNRYVLVGGTAIAWQIGHRVSYDIDLVTSDAVEHPRILRKRWNHAEIGKHKIIRRKPDHYVKFFATTTTPKIDVHGKLTGRGCIALPSVADNGLRIASLTDLLAQKMIAMCHRREQRDGIDVAAIIQDGRADIDLALDALCDEYYGVGEDEVENLLTTLADIDISPWRNIAGLDGLLSALQLHTPRLLKRVSYDIQGPVRLLPPNTTSDDGGHCGR